MQVLQNKTRAGLQQTKQRSLASDRLSHQIFLLIDRNWKRSKKFPLQQRTRSVCGAHTQSPIELKTVLQKNEWSEPALITGTASKKEIGKTWRAIAKRGKTRKNSLSGNGTSIAIEMSKWIAMAGWTVNWIDFNWSLIERRRWMLLLQFTLFANVLITTRPRWAVYEPFNDLTRWDLLQHICSTFATNIRRLSAVIDLSHRSRGVDGWSTAIAASISGFLLPIPTASSTSHLTHKFRLKWLS